jgi:predicted dehydrogenase
VGRVAIKRICTAVYLFRKGIAMPSLRTLRRRAFLGRSAAAGLAAVAAPAVFSRAGQVLGANDRIVMGIIGSGGRGRNVMKTHQAQGVEFAAVSDIYKPNLYEGLKLAGEKAQAYSDYRKLLEVKDLNAVLIGTPEHWHGPMLLDALAAGKDVYLEKPMSHSIEEGVSMVKAVRGTDRIVQIGMQRRSTPSVIAARELIPECGEIYLVKAYWNWDWSKPLNNSPINEEIDWKAFLGPAPWRQFEPQRFRHWRYFWDYSGGNCTDQGTHLMDVVQWFMGSGAPRAAVCYGSVYAMTGAETPDVFSAVFEYPKFMATWTLCYTNTMDNGWNIQFCGRKATLWLDNEGARLFASQSTGTTYKRSEKPAVVKEVPGSLSDEHHVRNFLDCLKSRKEPSAPVEVGHLAVCGPHLANVAFLHQTRARLNDDATRVFV